MVHKQDRVQLLQGATALHYAASSNNLEGVKWLLSCKASINAQDCEVWESCFQQKCCHLDCRIILADVAAMRRLAVGARTQSIMVPREQWHALLHCRVGQLCTTL